MMFRSLLLVVFCSTVGASAQQRFESGELKGFTKSATEHIIVDVEEPFRVSSVQGVIMRQGNNEPLEEVVFEIRGPGGSERIRAAKTNGNGRFTIRDVPDGTYLFKATRDGFQSVKGIIVVLRKTDRKSTIRVELPVGV